MHIFPATQIRMCNVGYHNTYSRIGEFHLVNREVVQFTVTLANMAPDYTTCKIHFPVKDTGIGIKEADN